MFARAQYERQRTVIAYFKRCASILPAMMDSLEGSATAIAEIEAILALERQAERLFKCNLLYC